MFESNCPICLRVYVEPVVMPCDHCLCKPCFDEVIKKANLQCPLCRRRIASWARLNSRNGTLVNQERWDYMREYHKDEVNARLCGKSTPRKKEVTMRGQFSVVLSNTGEIRKEYEIELMKIREERAREDQASEQLIKEILAQDERELAAFRTADKENKPSTGAQSARLPLPRRSSSIDSITGEFSRHFKPIVRYPRTPPRPTDKSKGYPDTIKVTPCPQTVKRLDFASSSSPRETSSEINKPGDAINSSSMLTRNQTKLRASSSSSVAGPSCMREADHKFLLPLQTGLSLDEHSNDGVSLLSSSTNTSKSNSGLRIEPCSPVIPLLSPGEINRVHQPSPKSRSHRSRNGASSDTISYRSDTSSTSIDNQPRQRGRPRKVKKNGHLNCKSSKVLLTNGNQSGDTNGTAANLANGSAGTKSRRAMTRSSTEAALNGSTLVRADSKPGRSSSVSTRTSVLGCNSVLSPTGGELLTATNGHPTGPAFVDPDEGLAQKLQTMYDMEKRYRLTALRYTGSGNEYNTRKRKKADP